MAGEFEWWKEEIETVSPDEYLPALKKLKDSEWEDLVWHVVEEMESELPEWVGNWLFERKKLKEVL